MRRHYWWLTGVDEGQTFLIFGSDKSEEDARMKGLELLSGIDFNVRRLNTRNTAEASRQLKGHKLENTHDLRGSIKRLRHKNIRRRNRR